jgi:perosamine synthetase
MLRFVAPAGAPIELTKILRAALAAVFKQPTDEAALRSLAADLKVKHAFGVSSGRCALTVILRSLGGLEKGRNIVALPAYTCFTVPAAVVRAGLRVHPLEIDPRTLDFSFSDLEKLLNDRVLAIVSSNLFGMPNNAGCIQAAARARGAFFVDDAAQAMGASRNGDAAGMMGDVGFYSFGRGKALAAMEGGLIVTNSDDIAQAIREEAGKLPPGSFVHAAWIVFQMLAYSLLLHPRLYWFPQSLPFLNLGTTEFDPQFRQSQMPAVVRELLIRTHNRLVKFNEVRRANAAALREGIEGNSLFATVHEPEESQPGYIRFPLIARDEATRDRAAKALQAAGYGATPLYPQAICDIEGIEPHMAVTDFHRPAAEDLSRRLLTLPTHPYVRPRDVRTMIAVLQRL